MQHSINTIFFLLLTIVLYVKSDSVCQADTNMPGIFQDSITLRLEKSRYKQSYQYPTALSKDTQPRIAISISKMETKNLSYISYQLLTTFEEAGSINFHLIFDKSASKWREIQINFWLLGSQINDMAVGNILMENINFASSQSLIYSYIDEPLLSKVNQGSLSDPKIFISSILGFQALSQENQFEISNDGNIISTLLASGKKNYTIQFKVTTGLRSKVNLIRLGYLLYCPSKLSVYKSHFSNNLSLQLNSKSGNQPTVSWSVLPQKLIIYPLKYMLLGITGLKISKQQSFSLEIALRAGNVDTIQLNSTNKVDNLKLNYLIVGMDMMMSCIRCSDSYVEHLSEGITCVGRKKCADDEIPMMDNEGIYYSCRKCIANSVIQVNNVTGEKTCVCKPGYTQTASGICNQIEVYKAIQECSDPNSERDPSSSRCICKKGYYPDDFGFCGGTCNPNNSYWDLNSEKCICLKGYQMDKNTNTCVPNGTSCGLNQIYVNGKCKCDGFMVEIIQGSTLICQECGSGTYKSDTSNECKTCNTTCRECISDLYCLACNKGYYFKDFKCLSRCGDGVRVNNEQCDDGNLLDGDGCSIQCTIESGFECKDGGNGKSLCNKIGQKPAQPQNKPTPATLTSNNTNISPKPVENPSINSSATKNQAQPSVDPSIYQLAVSKSSPIYLSSGISIELSIKPMKKHSQDELNNMLKVEVSDRRALPAMIYISQDPAHLESVRCYLHYNNQLPVIDFSIKLWVNFDNKVIKSLTLYSKVNGKLSRSIKPLQNDIYIQ